MLQRAIDRLRELSSSELVSFELHNNPNEG